MKHFILTAAFCSLLVSPAGAQEVSAENLCSAGVADFIPMGGLICQAVQGQEVTREYGGFAPHLVNDYGPVIPPEMTSPSNQTWTHDPCAENPNSFECEYQRIVDDLAAQAATVN